MKNSVLITLPQSDVVTEYLTAFSKSILDSAEKKNIRVTCLKREKASKKDFRKSLRDSHKLIIFNGHGKPMCIRGHKNKEVIKRGENENLLKNKIIYSRSCWSASELGKSIVQKGKDTCFVGYKIPFMFLSDITWDTNPIKDNLARIFLGTSNRFPIGIIKGQSAIQSHNNAKKSMLKAINKNLLKGDKNSLAIANALWNNYSGQTLLGNGNSKLN